MSDMKQQLKELLITELNLEDITLDEWEDDTPFFGEGLGLDSLDAVEIVVLVEKHYNVAIANAEEGKHALLNIITLTDFIKEKQTNA